MGLGKKNTTEQNTKSEQTTNKTYKPSVIGSLCKNPLYNAFIHWFRWHPHHPRRCGIDPLTHLQRGARVAAVPGHQGWQPQPAKQTTNNTTNHTNNGNNLSQPSPPPATTITATTMTMTYNGTWGLAMCQTRDVSLQIHFAKAIDKGWWHSQPGGGQTPRENQQRWWYKHHIHRYWSPWNYHIRIEPSPGSVMIWGSKLLPDRNILLASKRILRSMHHSESNAQVSLPDFNMNRRSKFLSRFFN